MVGHHWVIFLLSQAAEVVGHSQLCLGGRHHLLQKQHHPIKLNSTKMKQDIALIHIKLIFKLWILENLDLDGNI